jgi:hypothetical protein
MDQQNLTQRVLRLKARVGEMKNADLLPEYPVKITPHMSDNKIRQRKPSIWRKFTFETKG